MSPAPRRAFSWLFTSCAQRVNKCRDSLALAAVKKLSRHFVGIIVGMFWRTLPNNSIGFLLTLRDHGLGAAPDILVN